VADANPGGRGAEGALVAVRPDVRTGGTAVDRAGEASAGLLLQILYTIRSERLLMGQLDYNLLFRWFVGLEMDDPVWEAMTFSKNRERLLDADVAQAFFQSVIDQAKKRGLLSDEHFTVDGTQIAWAGQESFKRRHAGCTFLVG
jgi:transposase